MTNKPESPRARMSASPPPRWSARKKPPLPPGRRACEVMPGVSITDSDRVSKHGSDTLVVGHLVDEHPALRLQYPSFGLEHEDAKEDMHDLLNELEEQKLTVGDRCGSQFVINNENYFRIVWSILIVLMLVYTGTVFLYRLAFLEFKILINNESAEIFTTGEWWEILDKVMTTVFWTDLVVNFFFTYEDKAGHEVSSLRAIVRHYLCSHFIVDLAACLPEELIVWMIDSSTTGSATHGMKAFRLQRITRLARLLRLARLAKIVKHMKGPMWSWFQQQRGFHIINLTFGLGWVVHVMACGWYLCAALHDDPLDTWVARRTVDAAGDNLLSRPPIDQWMQAMYFTLTVFSTVGFGDMSAMTNGEIIYVCCMMLVGAMVHSIIISSVISVVKGSDDVKDFIDKHTRLVEAFSKHTEMGEGPLRDMKSWVNMSAKYWLSHQYDKQEMRDLIIGKIMPPSLLGNLPKELFHGKLVTNGFFNMKNRGFELPPRLPLMLALSVQKLFFSAGEMIYQAEDYAFGLFLVLTGTFSNIAYPAAGGGCSHLPDAASHLFLMPPERSASGHSCSARPSERPGAHQSPYRLVSHGGYFGDIEIFHNILRVSSARCESASGTLLLVSKLDLKEVVNEFPQFATKWRVAAKRRDQARILQLAELRSMQTFEELAARQLQTWIRRVQRLAQRGGSKSSNASDCIPIVAAIAALRSASPHKLKVEAVTLGSLQKHQDRMHRDIESLSLKMDAIVEVLNQVMEILPRSI
mmetsp:Transcript_113513/g.367239  ORF Transcript_113513/g.367239 Transcript_113513/m.367239 type:complete len:751 (-) Transcript_113513:154-2406(-)